MRYPRFPRPQPNADVLEHLAAYMILASRTVPSLGRISRLTTTLPYFGKRFRYPPDEEHSRFARATLVLA